MGAMINRQLQAVTRCFSYLSGEMPPHAYDLPVMVSLKFWMIKNECGENPCLPWRDVSDIHKFKITSQRGNLPAYNYVTKSRQRIPSLRPLDVWLHNIQCHTHRNGQTNEQPLNTNELPLLQCRNIHDWLEISNQYSPQLVAHLF